jgi:hypothetical protein
MWLPGVASRPLSIFKEVHNDASIHSREIFMLQQGALQDQERCPAEQDRPAMT